MYILLLVEVSVGKGSEIGMSLIYKTCKFSSNMLLTIMMSFLVSCYFSLPFPIVQWWYQIYRTCGWIIPLTYRCGAKISTGIFFGCDLVNWLMQVGLASDRGEAVMYGDRLMKGGVVQHITNEFEFRDEYLYYRFITKRSVAVESHWPDRVGRGQAVRGECDHFRCLHHWNWKYFFLRALGELCYSLM